MACFEKILTNRAQLFTRHSIKKGNLYETRGNKKEIVTETM
jgi:hypothetical protein